MPLRNDAGDEASTLTPTLSHLRVPRAGEGAARHDPAELPLARGEAVGEGGTRELREREGEGERADKSGASARPLPP